MEDTIGAAWPLEASADDNVALPPPWDGVADFENRTTEAALVDLQYRDPLLALRVCRSVFCRAEVRGDKQAALHALFLACVNLYNSSQRALADGVLAVVRERARGVGASHLSARIALADAKQLSEQGEHAQAMVVRQHALDLAMALGDNRVIFFALGGLAVSAAEAGESGLTLSLCAQQKPLLGDDDPVIAGAYFHHAVLMACAWIQIAHGHEIDGECTAARSALEQARTLALSACDKTNNDREALHCLETLVQILLLLDEAAEARAQVAHCVASLAAVPTVGSELWCVLELARARIDVHDGGVGAQTLKTLQTIEESVRQTASDVQLLVGDVRQVLLRAQEQLGHHEQALSSHKRATQWHANRRSAQSRLRVKMLRHAVLAMRAEAVEFIAHDLLTPLAAGQTWLQTLHGERLRPTRVPPLSEAQKLLDHAQLLSDEYLGLLRVELMPREHLQVLDFGALVDDVCENAAPPQASGLRLTRVIDIGTPVWGDVTLLTRALTALLADAFSRAPAGSQVDLLLSHDRVAGESVLSVSHGGPGPPPALRTRLYPQFFGSNVLGTGELGLALAAKVCRLHRMRLRFETARGAGSVVRVVAKTAACTTSVR